MLVDKRRKLFQDISVIITLDRWDTKIISEEIATKIINKMEELGIEYMKKEAY